MPDQKRQVDALILDIQENFALDSHERGRRKALLCAISARLQQDDGHVARSHPDRAQQFMPFAALKGYHKLAHERERVAEPKHILTEERAVELSQAIARLSKGTMVSVVHYEEDHYVTTCGVITEVDEVFRIIRIIRKTITFDNISSIEIQEPLDTL